MLLPRSVGEIPAGSGRASREKISITRPWSTNSRGCSTMSRGVNKVAAVKASIEAFEKPDRKDRQAQNVILFELQSPWRSSRGRNSAVSRGVAQPGRAPGSGPGGRRFKSSLPDHLFSIHLKR